jgi:gamma-glutamyltranspeptidase / glutathione hydrolase
MPLNANAIYPASDPEFISFPSRRSVVHGTEGMVACTQPLAARCGLRILQAGGNAAVRKLLLPPQVGQFTDEPTRMPQ